jgi:hypothetical protein
MSTAVRDDIGEQDALRRRSCTIRQEVDRPIAPRGESRAAVWRQARLILSDEAAVVRRSDDNGGDPGR